MNHKPTILTFLTFILLVLGIAQADDKKVIIDINFEGVPITSVIKDYENIMQRVVAIDIPLPNAEITLHASALTRDEYRSIVIGILKSCNITISTNSAGYEFLQKWTSISDTKSIILAL